MNTNLIASVAENKKAEIDELALKVQVAEYEVTELQAVVTALSTKSEQFSTALTGANAKKEAALANFNQIKATANAISELLKNITIAEQQTSTASSKINDTSATLANLIQQLIFAAEVVGKLSEFVNKKNAANKIIPMELVTALATATTDANTAVAATLTALKASYTAESTGEEAAKVTELELQQAQSLNALIMGDKVNQAEQQSFITAASAAIAKVEAALIKLQTAESNVKTAAANVATLQTQIDTDKNSVASASSALESAKQDVVVKAAAVVKAQSDLDNAKEEQKEAAQAKVDSAKAALDTAKQAVSTAQASLSTAQSSLSSKQHQLEQQCFEYQQAQAALLAATKKVDASVTALNFIANEQQDNALYHLQQQAYQTALESYQHALKANSMATQQLDHAQAELANATTNLNSLKAGLAAAKAAAFAA